MGAFLRRDDIGETMEQVYERSPFEGKANQAAVSSPVDSASKCCRQGADDSASVLMLDEPTAGVSPTVMDELFDRIIEVARSGISILMVEQNARQALGIADRGYVLVQGENRYTDTGAALLADQGARVSVAGWMF